MGGALLSAGNRMTRTISASRGGCARRGLHRVGVAGGQGVMGSPVVASAEAPEAAGHWTAAAPKLPARRKRRRRQLNINRPRAKMTNPAIPVVRNRGTAQSCPRRD
jgi:hypothetical protein